jgi:hypothetical protein
MKQGELKANQYLYGNKGAVWSDEVHIAEGSSSTTLCGVPMLSNNWAQIEGIDHAGCSECIQLAK